MSVYDEITQAIIAELEQGVPPWVKSWSSHLPMNVISQKEYRGINILLLWKEDKRAIFKAASHATKAADYLREKSAGSELQEAV
jgi:antirestriction protein ArdC